MDEGYASGAPVPGEHTKDVLARLAGLSEEEITALVDAGITN
jgi:crotonobetainyl-CoA:carnitine CoA-transferase CaiB-like acyl-CoA transferase